MASLLVWHFLPTDGCVKREGIRVVPGQTLRLPDSAQPKLCDAGYHGSVRAIDALGYASSAIVERVALSGTVLQGVDKACASERTCIAVADATTVLFEFACWSAERALMRQRNAGREPDVRCWAAVAARRAWLRGEITDAQLIVARDAAWAAAWDAAKDAACDAAGWRAAYAACDAAGWDAACNAAWDAARGTAYATERAVQNAELERQLRALLQVAT